MRALRWFFAAGWACMLLGCSTSPEPDPVLATVRQAFSGPPPYAPRRLPYDSLILRRSDGALWAQAVLGRIDSPPGFWHWFVGQQSVRTDAVRPTKAVATAFDFILEPKDPSSWGQDPVRLACLRGTVQQREDWLDFPAADVWSLTRRAEILPRATPEAPVEERFRVDELGWSGVNRYWLDADCRPRRALVWLHPQQPAWEMRWLRAGEAP